MSRLRPLTRLEAALAATLIALAACGGGSTAGSTIVTTTETSAGPATTTTAAPTTTASPSTTTTLAPPDPIQAELTETDRTLTLDSDEVRVVVDRIWGGAIREIWVDGTNVVNNYDGGRLLGISVYDSSRLGAGGHPNDTGWNPTPSDWHDHANPIEFDFDGTTLHVTARHLQWFPEGHGGGSESPIPTDVIVETWIRFLDDRRTVHVRYRLTHEGDDEHTLAAQEFPFAYTRSPFHWFVAYSGDEPWTGSETVPQQAPVYPETTTVAATEHWGGFVRDDGLGLIMWAPQAYPAFDPHVHQNLPPAENSTTYFRPLAFGAIGPGVVWETEVILLAGDWHAARERIYELQERMTFADTMPPFGFLDSLEPGSMHSGDVTVSGWAIDDRGISRVLVFVDGQQVGVARYGLRRPDVAAEYPGMPGGPLLGYQLTLDAGTVELGAHTIHTVAVDAAGNMSILRPGPIEVTISG